MKLVELEPRWATGTLRHGMGMSFLCPVCQKYSIFVAFKNPLDGGPPWTGQPALFQRTGTTFETLTLDPSVDASKYYWRDKMVMSGPCIGIINGLPVERAGHWHGHIQNGLIVGM